MYKKYSRLKEIHRQHTYHNFYDKNWDILLEFKFRTQQLMLERKGHYIMHA
jgi:hypothetical protein